MKADTEALRSRDRNRISCDGESLGVNWIEFYEREVKPRLTVGLVFGNLDRARISGGKVRAPCPIHQGRNRNFVVDPKTCRWYCHSQCNEGGGPIEFVHRIRGATGTPRGRAFVEILKDLAARCALDVPETRVREQTGQWEAASVWNDARAVTSDAEVARWLANERRLEPELIAAHDLARVVSPRIALPRWAGYLRGEQWQSWPSSGYRVIVPLFSARGKVSSLRFRKPSAGAKGRSAMGVSGVGLVMADRIAYAVLAAGCEPSFWSGSPFTVVIAEGEPDFWSWATEPARRGLGDSATSFPPVLGVVSGSFDRSVAIRLPVGTHVVSAMDRDRGGDQIHARLARTLAEVNRNLTLSRWSPE